MNVMVIFLTLVPIGLPVLVILLAGQLLLCRRSRAGLGWILPGVCLGLGLGAGALAVFFTPGGLRLGVLALGVFGGLALILGIVGFFWRKSWQKRQLAQMKIQDL